jgi:hypothetical protein
MTMTMETGRARLARTRAGQIRQGVHDYFKTLALVGQAWEDRDWEALGYDSWEEYVDGEFSEVRLRLSAEHRQKAIVERRLAGMSQRAIGSTVGVSAATVNRDLAGVSDETPDAVTGLDGKRHAATRPQPVRRAVVKDGPAKTEATSGHPAGDLPGIPRGANAPAGGPMPPSVPEAPRSTPVPGRDESFPAEPETRDSLSSTEDGLFDAPSPAHESHDPLVIDEETKRRSSLAFAKSLASLWLALDPDPVNWVATRWRPDVYPERDLPRVRDVFTTTGLRSLAKHIDAIADHLDRTGGAL